MNIDKLTPVNGRILLKKNDNDLWEVLSVAKNVSYEGTPSYVKEGDIVIVNQYSGTNFSIPKNPTGFKYILKLVSAKHIIAFYDKK